MFDEPPVPQGWTFPVPIACGPGRPVENDARGAGFALKRPLIVTGSGSSGLPLVSDLQRVPAVAGPSIAVRRSEAAGTPATGGIAE